MHAMRIHELSLLSLSRISGHSGGDPFLPHSSSEEGELLSLHSHHTTEHHFIKAHFIIL